MYSVIGKKKKKRVSVPKNFFFSFRLEINMLKSSRPLAKI